MARLCEIIDEFQQDLTRYEGMYRRIHQNPELSMLEVETATWAGNHLKDLGFDGIISGLGGH